MGKYRGSSGAAVLIILCVFLMIIFSVLVLGDLKHHGSCSREEEKAVVGRYWDRVKVLLNQANIYFFPPNIEPGGEGEEPEGSGEKVKEAVGKSLERGKAAMEGSARSMGEIAGKTVQKSKDKVKKSLCEL